MVGRFHPCIKGLRARRGHGSEGLSPVLEDARQDGLGLSFAHAFELLEKMLFACDQLPRLLTDMLLAAPCCASRGNRCHGI